MYKKLMFSIIAYGISSGFCQNVPVVLKILYVPLSKTQICKGDSATAEVYGFWVNPTGPNNGTEPINLVEKKITFGYPGCHDQTEVVQQIQPTLQGDSGKITQVIYNDWLPGGNCTPYPDRNGKVKITLKPAVSTHYVLSWQVRNRSNINNVNCLCVTVFPEWIESYYAEFDVVVIQPKPPKIITQDTAVNLNSNFYLRANANFETSHRLITWYQKSCDTFKKTSVPLFGYSDPNPIQQGFSAREVGKMEMRAKISDLGCVSDFSDSVNVYVKPCRTLTSGCDQTLVNNVESNSCDNNAHSRSDYHFYHLEKNLCSACDLETMWRRYKRDISNQAIILSDQTFSLGRLFGNTFNMWFSKFFFDQETYNVPMRDCMKVLLPRITNFIAKLSYTIHPEVEPLTRLCGNDPENFTDSILIRIDETNKCVTNYTLPTHMLSPGKVTRCLVKECDGVKIFTFGEGTTKFPNTLCGELIKHINSTWGESMFTNVDERTVTDIVFKTWFNPISDNHFKTTAYSIVNKNWQVEKFEVKYPESDSMFAFFTFGDSENFYNLKQLNIYFADSGRYTGVTVDGDYTEGHWEFDSIGNKLLIDSAVAEIVSHTANEFKAKFIVPVYKDTFPSSAECYLTLHNRNLESRSYTFTGNGNWNDPAMWLNSQVPPLDVPYGNTVYINPTGPNAKCTLNGSLVVRRGAKFRVESNKKFIINGDVTFK